VPSELVGLVGGFLIAATILAAVLPWVGCLWVAYQDYRTAVDYPHLGRSKRLWVFVPLTLLHSGPWTLALTVFGAFILFRSPREAWHAWFVGGFVAYFALMGLVIVAALKKREAPKANIVDAK
jgi:hypothetical protein